MESDGLGKYVFFFLLYFQVISPQRDKTINNHSSCSPGRISSVTRKRSQCVTDSIASDELPPLLITYRVKTAGDFLGKMIWLVCINKSSYFHISRIVLILSAQCLSCSLRILQVTPPVYRNPSSLEPLLWNSYSRCLLVTEAANNLIKSLTLHYNECWGKKDRVFLFLVISHFHSILTKTAWVCSRTSTDESL